MPLSLFDNGTMRFSRSQFLVSCGICDSKNAVFSGVCPNGFAECLTLRNPKAAGFVENGGFEGVFLRQQVLEGRLPHDEATARLAYRQIYSFIAPHIQPEKEKQQ